MADDAVIVPHKPPGKVAWGMTILSLVGPVIAVGCGWLGITNGGNDIRVPWFVAGFAGLVLSLLLSIVVHFWGLLCGFYPTVSKAWITICLLGMVGGVLTLVAGVVLWLKMFGLISPEGGT